MSRGKGKRMQASQGRAAGIMVASMALIGVIDNYIAPLSAYVGLWQFHFTRALAAVPLIAVVACVMGLHHLRMRSLLWVVLRSLALGLSMLCYFGALGIMPIAEALAGQFTSPLFVLLMTMALTGQRVGPFRIAAVLVGFAGVLLVLQPNPSDFDPWLLLPVLGGAFYAVSAMLTRYRCAEESPLTLLLGMFVTLGTLGAVGLLFVSDPQGDFLSRGWVWPMGPALGLVVMQAVGSLIAVYGIIRAYQWGEPSRMAVFEYSVMIFGPLYGWAALGQAVGLWQVAGIALIAGAGAVIALRSGS